MPQSIETTAGDVSQCPKEYRLVLCFYHLNFFSSTITYSLTLSNILPYALVIQLLTRHLLVKQVKVIHS